MAVFCVLRGDKKNRSGIIRPLWEKGFCVLYHSQKEGSCYVMKHLKIFALLIALNLVLFLVGPGVCQGEDFPTRPITIIVNYGAGGSTDVTTRLLAKIAEKELGVPIIIQNRAGGGGTIGIVELVNQKSDGYTLGTTTGGVMVNTPLMQRVTYDPFKDFDYICGYGGFYYGIFTRTDSPFNSIKDVVETARREPGKITYGAVSPSTAIGMKYVELKENIKMGYVSFRGGAALGAAMVGKHINLAISSDVYQWLATGEVRGLAVVTERRWPELPDVPTMKELGYDIDLTGLMALAAPKGVPKDRLNKIYEAFKTAANDLEVKERLQNLHIWHPFISGDEVLNIFQQKTKEWKPLIDTILAEKEKK